MNKTIVAVLYGGKSAEHDVSIQSGKTVAGLVDENGFKVLPVYIDRGGRWFLQDKPGGTDTARPVVPLLGREKSAFLDVKAGKEIDFDAAFPILHGPMGEDGTMQGLLELCAIPYVGCGVLASAVGMDKEVCKLLAREAGLPVLKHIVLDRADFSVSRAEKQVEALGYPVFVKPMCMGSSVGITKVDAPSELEAAVLKAFEYDRRVMVEKGVSHAREIMCAVLGSGDDVTASVCGEVRPVNHEFFDYESKYEDERGMEFTLPAKIPEDLSERIRALSVTVFRAIRGEGFARVDFLLHPETGELYFGEINTAPGFTSHSLYPRLFAESGIKPADAVCRLLHIAFKRQEESKHTSVYR